MKPAAKCWNCIERTSYFQIQHLGNCDSFFLITCPLLSSKTSSGLLSAELTVETLCTALFHPNIHINSQPVWHTRYNTPLISTHIQHSFSIFLPFQNSLLSEWADMILWSSSNCQNSRRVEECTAKLIMNSEACGDVRPKARRKLFITQDWRCTSALFPFFTVHRN